MLNERTHKHERTHNHARTIEREEKRRATQRDISLQAQLNTRGRVRLLPLLDRKNKSARPRKCEKISLAHTLNLRNPRSNISLVLGDIRFKPRPRAPPRRRQHAHTKQPANNSTYEPRAAATSAPLSRHRGLCWADRPSEIRRVVTSVPRNERPLCLAIGRAAVPSYPLGVRTSPSLTRPPTLVDAVVSHSLLSSSSYW